MAREVSTAAHHVKASIFSAAHQVLGSVRAAPEETALEKFSQQERGQDQNFPSAPVEKKDLPRTIAWTKLHDAAWYGNVKEAQHLLRSAADVNAVANKWNTPLHIAANEGNTALMRVLLANGADCDVTGTSAEIPLDYARARWSLDAWLLCAQALMLRGQSGPFWENPAEVTRRLRQFEQDVFKSLLGAPEDASLPFFMHATRVDNPPLWARYKSRRDQLSGLAAFDVQSHVGTDLHVRALQGLGIWNTSKLHHAVNEVFLWHVTQNDAAANICKNGFRIFNRPQHNGWRYGRGLYLGDELDRCLMHARDAHASSCSIFLCRVTLGDVYFTRENSGDSSAAYRRGKHSLVAEPPSSWAGAGASGSALRTFVHLDEALIYPEFMIEFLQGPQS